MTATRVALRGEGLLFCGGLLAGRKWLLVLRRLLLGWRRGLLVCVQGLFGSRIMLVVRGKSLFGRDC